MFISPAFAQTAGAQPSGTAAFLAQSLPLILIFVIFYVLLIRPQQTAAKRHKAKVESVRKGDQVVTGGGLMGKVTRVEDTTVEIELAPGMKVKAVKATLSDVVPLNAAKPAND
jgi:preprotein translocase subunit YajC